jgi:hypothetical protein
MEQRAQLYRGKRDPVYHAVVSWRPGETVSIAQASEAADTVLASLGLGDHQTAVAMHFDEQRDSHHLHIVTNLVDEAGRCATTWQDFSKRDAALEYLERMNGYAVDRHSNWRSRINERDLEVVLPGLADCEVDASIEAPSLVEIERGGTSAAKDARRAAGYSWEHLLREKAAPAIRAASKRNGAAWSDLHAVARVYGIAIEPAGSGYRITGAEPGLHVRASRIGIDARELNARLGAFTVDPKRITFDTRLAAAKDSCRDATSWDTLHAILEVHGVAVASVDASWKRGQIIDLEGDRRAAARALGLGSLPEMIERLGDMPTAPAIERRNAEEGERRLRGITAKAEMLAADPAQIIAQLEGHDSTWHKDDVRRAVTSKLGIRAEQRSAYASAIETVAQATLKACEAIEVLEGEWVFTTAAVRAQEQLLFASAGKIAETALRAPLGPPTDSLDAQQREAYEHAVGASGLRIVTGIAGAGKSRLQRDVVRAFGEAGFRVIGAAVSSEAARVLGVEAQVAARTVARLLADLDRGAERLTARDMILIDEAGTLGARDACRLLAHAAKSGAVVRLFGDAAQHEAVAAGSVLTGLVREHGSYDMGVTRRAREQWLRACATDLRSGRVAPALDALRTHGGIAQHQTHDDACEALAAKYVAGLAGGCEALLLADRNDDVRALNRAVQSRLHAAGALGVGREYYSIYDGSTAVHVGDVLAIRGRAAASNATADPWINGDRGRVIELREDGKLLLERERDGLHLLWDIGDERTGGQWRLGYAMTSHTSQGRTVDDVYVLGVSGTRSAYVGITRARESVHIAYGEDRVRDFGALLYEASRIQSKTLVRDADREHDQLTSKRGGIKRADNAASIGSHDTFAVEDRERERGIDELIAARAKRLRAAEQLEEFTRTRRERSRTR